MKRKFLYSSALLGVFLVGVHYPLVVSAESVSTQSNAYVGIEPNNGENGVDPVNPLDPTQPVTPGPGEDGEENPHAPSTKGPLSINYISNLQFGMNQATGDDAVYNVKPDRVVNSDGEIIQVPNYVQITDNRGTNAGWTLTVQQNNPFTNGTNSLDGTEIVFTNPVAVGRSGGVNTTPTVNANFTLAANGQANLVMFAIEDQGMGTWVNRFGESVAAAPTSIVLKVPGDSKKIAGRYKTSLTWTLSDVPMDE